MTLDEQRYALALAQVERVIRAVEITLLPKAPEIISGVINVRGKVIPVINVRRRFRLPERALSISDQIVISHTSRRAVALIVDEVNGIIELSGYPVMPAGEILPHMEYVEGVVKLKDGLILIHDLDRFLSLEEEKTLNHALSASRK